MINDTLEILGVMMTLEDAERLQRWFESPEYSLFKRIMETQRETFDEQSEREIGANAISDVLNRERSLSARLALKSVLMFPEDLKQTIIAEKEILKNSQVSQ